MRPTPAKSAVNSRSGVTAENDVRLPTYISRMNSVVSSALCERNVDRSAAIGTNPAIALPSLFGPSAAGYPRGPGSPPTRSSIPGAPQRTPGERHQRADSSTVTR